MRKIIKIAIAELKTLFFSPIAWLVLVIFTVQCGLTFFEIANTLRKNFLLGSSMSMLTAEIFTGPFGMFTKAQENLYLYFPLLTMGLMSREMSSGSIKLLLSSPIKLNNIIFGKYLAMVVYSLLLTTILVLYAVAAGLIVESADYTLLLSGILGLFLLMCIFSAIGLFLSTLTPYQVVAAIYTLIVLAGLQYISRIGQGLDYVRDITNFLFLSSKANAMITGMISSRELCYFVLMIVLFLGFSIFRLQSGRERKPLYHVIGKYLTLTLIVLSLGFLSAQQKWVAYIDMTATKVLTISPTSQEIARQIKGPLKVTTYVNLLNEKVNFGLPRTRAEDLKNMEGFMRFIPDLKMEYVYYYDYSSQPGLSRNFIKDAHVELSNGAKMFADSMGLDFDLFLSPAQLKKQIDLSTEDYNLIRQVEYRGKKSFIRFYNDMINVPTEAEITSSLKKLIQEPPVIGFLTGHGERSAFKMGDQDYSSIISRKGYRTALVNKGFDVMEFDLQTQEIPAGLAVLVLADPTTALDPTVLQKLKTYMDNGGNMMVLGEAGRQELLNPLLKALGLNLMPGVLVKGSATKAPSQIDGVLSKEVTVLDTLLAPLEALRVTIETPGTAALSLPQASDFKISEILKSDEGSWLTSKTFDVTDSAQFDLLAGDVKGDFPIMVCLSREVKNKQQRILVSGDADFMSNAALMRHNPALPIFTDALFKWFSYGSFPVNIERKPAPDQRIKVNRLEFRMLKFTMLLGIPLMIILAGSFLLTRRKRK